MKPSRERAEQSSPPPDNSLLSGFMSQLLHGSSVSIQDTILLQDNAAILCESASRSIAFENENAARQTLHGGRRAAYAAGNSSLTKEISRWESYPFPLRPSAISDNSTRAPSLTSASHAALEAPLLPRRRLSINQEPSPSSSEGESEAPETNARWSQPAGPSTAPSLVAAALLAARAAATTGPRFPSRQHSFSSDISVDRSAASSTSDDEEEDDLSLPSLIQNHLHVPRSLIDTIASTCSISGSSCSSSSSGSNSSSSVEGGPRLPTSQPQYEQNTCPRHSSNQEELTRAAPRMASVGSELDKLEQSVLRASRPTRSSSLDERLREAERFDLGEKLRLLNDGNKRTTSSIPRAPQKPSAAHQGPRFPRRRNSFEHLTDGSIPAAPSPESDDEEERSRLSCDSASSARGDEQLSVRKALTLLSTRRPPGRRRTAPEKMSHLLTQARATVFLDNDDTNCGTEQGQHSPGNKETGNDFIGELSDSSDDEDDGHRGLKSRLRLSLNKSMTMDFAAASNATALLASSPDSASSSAD